MMSQPIVANTIEVPYMAVTAIEADAQSLLEDFSDKFSRLTKPPVPVDEIAELHLQLILVFKDMKEIFPFADIHGAIWFDSGLIGIDSSLDPGVNPLMLGRYRFTLAHEIGHWRLHRNYFKTSPHEHIPFDNNLPMSGVACRAVEKRTRVEWQADQFAAYLLMPQYMLLEAWQELRGGDLCPIEQAEIHELTSGEVITYHGREPQNQTERDRGASELFCRPLADTFQVSREAMRIRLESLNWIVTSRASTLPLT